VYLSKPLLSKIIQFFGLALLVLGWMQVVLQTKEMITKQAGKIAKRADEHEAFITKVLSLSRSCTFSLTQYGSVPVMPKGCSFVHCLV
jgi:hypothetical protein